MSVHPGAVATEQQKGAAEAYGLLGKALEVGSKLLFMSPEQGSESALWAGTAESVVPRRDEVQGRYFTEADGKVSCSRRLFHRQPSLCARAIIDPLTIYRSTPNPIKPKMMYWRSDYGILASKS
jgi:hypothetical protein